MNTNETWSVALKDLTVMEILALIAQAKTGTENAIETAPAGALSDAKDALEWFIEVLVNKTE